MNEVNAKIIDKIEKLLALAQSSNEHEARLAADKANELLTMYNLTLDQIRDADDNAYERDTLTENKIMQTQDKFICPLIQEYFFVNLVKHRARFGSTKVYILGSPTNIRIARFVYDFLSRKFPELWDAYKFETGAKVGAKQSYYMGLHKGLAEQFAATRTKCESSTGLTVIKDPKLDEFMRDIFKNLSEAAGQSAPPIRDREAMNDGVAHGRELRINRGVESHTAERGRLIGG